VAAHSRRKGSGIQVAAAAAVASQFPDDNALVFVAVLELPVVVVIPAVVAAGELPAGLAAVAVAATLDDEALAASVFLFVPPVGVVWQLLVAPVLLFQVSLLPLVLCAFVPYAVFPFPVALDVFDRIAPDDTLLADVSAAAASAEGIADAADM